MATSLQGSHRLRPRDARRAASFVLFLLPTGTSRKGASPRLGNRVKDEAAQEDREAQNFLQGDEGGMMTTTHVWQLALRVLH
jgi:hypothetical protein